MSRKPATLFTVCFCRRSYYRLVSFLRQYLLAVQSFTRLPVTGTFAQRAGSSSETQRASAAHYPGVGWLVAALNVFVRDIKAPQSIEQARIAAAQQAQVLDKAQKQFTIDSVNARAQVMTAQASAEAKRLEAASYATNPALLQLEIAKANAEGLARACAGPQVTTCVIGGTTADIGMLRRP